MGRRWNLIRLGVARGTDGAADTTAPAVVITSTADATVTGPFDVTLTASEVVTLAGTLTVTNGSATEPVDSGDGLVWTATVTPTADGAVSVQAGAGVFEDGAGNPSTASNVLSRTADLYLVYDTFADLDATRLNAHAPDIVDPGNAWSELVGTWTISSNIVGATSGASAYALIDAGGVASIVQARVLVGAANWNVSVHWRAQDAANNWGVQLNDSTNQIRLWENTSGGGGLRTSVAYAIDPLTWYDVKIVDNGSLMTVFINDVEVLSWTSTVHASNTKVGLSAYTNAAARWDSIWAK